MCESSSPCVHRRWNLGCSLNRDVTKQLPCVAGAVFFFSGLENARTSKSCFQALRGKENQRKRGLSELATQQNLLKHLLCRQCILWVQIKGDCNFLLVFFSLVCPFIFCVKQLNIHRSRAGPYKGNSRWHYCKKTKKKPFCFAAVLCQFDELWFPCFSWLTGFTISKIKSVQNFSGEVLYWFRAMVGLSHLKIRSWGHWIDYFCSTRLPNTDFPVVGCCHFAPLVIHPRTPSYREGHICLFNPFWHE